MSVGEGGVGGGMERRRESCAEGGGAKVRGAQGVRVADTPVIFPPPNPVSSHLRYRLPLLIAAFAAVNFHFTSPFIFPHCLEKHPRCLAAFGGWLSEVPLVLSPAVVHIINDGIPRHPILRSGVFRRPVIFRHRVELLAKY